MKIESILTKYEKTRILWWNKEIDKMPSRAHLIAMRRHVEKRDDMRYKEKMIYYHLINKKLKEY